MRKATRIVLRLVVAVLAVAVPLLVAEGVCSLVTGRSLVRRLAGLVEEPSPRMRLSDEDRAAAARRTPGPWFLARDPRVGFRMKSGITHAFHGVEATTDVHGMRVRTGPPPEDGAARVVVLGDSVAFGFGVADDETYAEQLERLLGDTVADGRPRPAAFTVGCPGWTAENALAYLSGHLHRYRPDVVYFILVNNDLQDGFNVTESGYRELLFDPVRGGDRPHVSGEAYDRLRRVLAPRAPLSVVADVVAHGGPSSIEHVMKTWVTPASKARWRRVTRGLRDLRDRLAGHGGRLVLVLRWDDYDFERLAEHVVSTALPDLPILLLFSGRRMGEDTLDGDPHPGPRCVRAGAWRMADWLVREGDLPGVGARPLPPEDEAYATRRARRFPVPESADWLRRYHDRITRFITPVIDLATATGFHQVYSEVDPDDGTVGRHLACALARGSGSRLELTLTRLPASSRVYPQTLRATFGTVAGGEVAIPEPAAGEALDATVSFPVPAGVTGSHVDVTITASHVAAETHRGTTRLAAFRLRRVELVR